MPVLCNHCDEPACISNCPTSPTATFKTPEGYVLINDELCTGCQACQQTCPYSVPLLDDRSLTGETYSVISMNHYESENSFAVRARGVVEKCTFCHHRVSHGVQPACVEVCPSKARIFGDQQDSGSEIAKLLASEKTFRLKEENGTKPNVFYIHKFSPRA